MTEKTYILRMDNFSVGQKRKYFPQVTNNLSNEIFFRQFFAQSRAVLHKPGNNRNPVITEAR